MRAAHFLALVVVVVCVAVGIAVWRDARTDSVVACRQPDRSEVRLSGGTFRMGAGSDAADGIVERDVSVAAFSIDRFAVTNADFAAFVAATGYVTDAERAPNPADFPDVPADKLVAGGAVFHRADTSPHNADETQWWRFVRGATWRHPEGPKSTIEGRESYPVVQVSYNDALAYAQWRGRALPTEEQFEFAARGGLDGKPYAWGDDVSPNGKPMANTWQGEFPARDTGADGFAGLAPGGCFPANDYDLHDMTGNVWQWTSTAAEDESTPAARTLRIIKGGSFLCAADFCHRYRPAARQSQESNFGSMHIGFRTVSR